MRIAKEESLTATSQQSSHSLTKHDAKPASNRQGEEEDEEGEADEKKRGQITILAELLHVRVPRSSVSRTRTVWQRAHHLLSLAAMLRERVSRKQLKVPLHGPGLYRPCNPSPPPWSTFSLPPAILRCPPHFRQCFASWGCHSREFPSLSPVSPPSPTPPDVLPWLLSPAARLLPSSSPRQMGPPLFDGPPR